ncbi:MAG: Rieske 2Fe-2S domain-containing protein, partial [Terracidiphilus sp.]|nr:Rieske 2Fe-2S domain-containing protein [Terracidiphilus sp.]
MPPVTTSETGLLIPGPSATLIYDDWYPALRTSTLRPGKLATAMLLDIPLVLGRRADGSLFAMRDSCPHRGIPLSVGWFDGNRVTCRYHGWEFEPCSGRCEVIPSLSSHDHLDPTRIYAQAYPCQERDGHAWVYIPSPGSGKQTPVTRPVPELAKFGPRYRAAFLTADLPCNVDHGIIGLMDPAHGPFVHQAWWWRSRSSIREKTKRFEPIPEGFRMSAHAPSANSAPYKLLGVYGQPV